MIAEFLITVTLLKPHEPPKLGAVEFKNGVCETRNGSASRKRDVGVCEKIAKEIPEDKPTVPWINPESVASFVINYQGHWKKQTGLSPDPSREIYRKFAIDVLNSAL